MMAILANSNFDPSEKLFGSRLASPRDLMAKLPESVRQWAFVQEAPDENQAIKRCQEGEVELCFVSGYGAGTGLRLFRGISTG